VAGQIRLRHSARSSTIGRGKASAGGLGMDERYLRSGIFLAPFHNHDENPTLSIERDLELLEHLDRLNYHEAWIGEHHSGGFELIACPEMFIAAAAQRTRHIRLGTGVVSLPYHNPFMLADRMVQLDHMTRGRAMFGVGPGALVHDALKIGIDPGEQRRMMNESFDVIVRLLHGETVDCQTDWFNLTEAQLQLRPYTRPTMELAVAAARSPSGRVWRPLRAGAELGRLGGDQTALRADGAVCPSALPAEPRVAARQL
jgi:limonene 1,2-monooxygenase